MQKHTHTPSLEQAHVSPTIASAFFPPFCSHHFAVIILHVPLAFIVLHTYIYTFSNTFAHFHTHLYSPANAIWNILA